MESLIIIGSDPRKNLFCVLLLAGMTTTTPAFSDENEDLMFADIPSVFSASKYEQKTTEAPARISIVTAEEIERYGHRTLADILKSLPGFQMTNDRSYSYIGSRGFNIPGDFNSRILLLVDGHRVNENIYDGMIIDQGAVINTDLIERVEVVRGPASSLYGSSAFFGVINVFTKRGRDYQGTEVAVDGGSFNTRQGRLTYGNRFDNGIELLLSGSAYESDGNDRLYYAEFDDPSSNNGIAENMNGAEQQNLHAKLSYGDYTFSGTYSEQTVTIPTASYDTIFNDPRTRSTEGQAFLDLKYQSLLESGADISARVFYDDYWYHGDWAYDYAEAGDPPDEVLFKDLADGDWWGTEAMINAMWFDNHRMIIGAEYRDSLKEKQQGYDPYDTYLDINTDKYSWAIFAQDEFKINSNFTLNFGLRYDYFSTSGDTLNPRIAAIWSPAETTAIKLLYGRAFRAPNAYELYYQDGDATQKVADKLDPETIDSYELIWEQTINMQLRLIASVYHNEIKKLISLTVDPVDELLVFQNIDQATAEGAELELIAKNDSGWAGSFSHSYQRVEDDSSEHLVNSALNMSKINITTPLLAGHFGAGLEVQYESGRKTLSGNKTEDRIISNLTLFSQNLTEGLKVSASVYDLFNEAPAVPGFEEHYQDQLAQDGRTYRLKLAYTF